MAVVNNEALTLTNMTSATIHQYKASSLFSTEGWWLGYANSTSNCNLRIAFTPSKTLSKVVFKLTASTYSQLGSKPCYYYLTTTSDHPDVSSINSNGKSFTFSDKVATITLSQTFTAGTTYYLWVAHTSGDQNFAATFKTSGITCTSTVATYTVKYDANGGSGAPSSQTKTHGVALTLSSTKPTKASTTATGSKITFDANGGTTTKASQTATDTVKYTFSKWNTAANGSGTSYSSGGSYTANASVTLYAQYTSSTTKGEVTLPTLEQCSRAGYKLLGFATSASATEAEYAPGASYTANADITLYAVWEAQGLVYIDDGTGFEPYQVWVDNGSSWEQYAPFVDNGTTWEEMS